MSLAAGAKCPELPVRWVTSYRHPKCAQPVFKAGLIIIKAVVRNAKCLHRGGTLRPIQTLILASYAGGYPVADVALDAYS